MKKLLCSKSNCLAIGRNRKLICLIIVFLMLLPRCNKDEDPVTLQDYVPISEKAEFNKPLETHLDTVRLDAIDTATAVQQNKYFICKTTKHSLSENPGAFVVSDPLEGTVLPGLLVQGSSVFKGVPVIIPIDEKRKKIKVFLTVISGTGSTISQEVKATQSDITQAMNAILNNYSGGFPARYNYESKLITSQSQLEAALKVGWSNPNNNLSAKMQFNYDENKTSLLVSLTQTFFTFSVDALSEATTFTDGKTPGEITQYLKKEDDIPNPLAYISSVTYGRVYKFLMTVDEKNFDLKTAVDYAYDGPTNDIKVKLRAAYQKKLNTVRISVFQIGGDASSGLATAFLKNPPKQMDSIRNFIVGGANFSKNNVGAPISYIVKSLKDNKVIRINNTLEWEEKEYIPIDMSKDPTKVIDIDGNLYPVVKIGTQTWMAENLRTTRLKGGTLIKPISSGLSFVAAKQPAFCGSPESNYGLLYNYYTILSDSVCPVGWHVPYKEEFELLGKVCDGKALKASGNTYWDTGNTGTNSSGFNAKGSGRMKYTGTMDDVKRNCFLWTMDNRGSHGSATAVYLQYNVDGIYYLTDEKDWNGYSLRCVKN